MWGNAGDLRENKQKKSKLYPKRRMNFKPIKFYYEIDEATSMKIKSLCGKNNFNSKDFQKIITTLISKTYEEQKGKPVR